MDATFLSSMQACCCLQITALKNLGLNIRKAQISQKSNIQSKQKQNTFYITEAQTSEKIIKSARLEEIRMTVLNSLTSKFPVSCNFLLSVTVCQRWRSGWKSFLIEPSFHSSFQDSASFFNFGSNSGYESDGNPVTSMRMVVPTTIDMSEASNGTCSILKIRTADRPGLLVDIVRVLKDVNLNVVSAEVDTIGTEAQDEFFVTYQVSML
jgi:UTP:GlnB (protein PII) uridylyltransferase